MITSCINYLRTKLIEDGFHRLPLSDDRVFSFLKQVGEHLYVVNLYDFKLYDEIRWLQSIKRFETDLYSYFSRYPIHRKFILNIFVGGQDLEALYAILEKEPMNLDSEIMTFSWFLDLDQRKLLIPPHIPNKLVGVEKILQGYLKGATHEAAKERPLYRFHQRSQKSPMTYAFIASNIAVFVLLQMIYFGRLDDALVQFGLNSPMLFDKMEYWRLFTSMFTHLTIPHLLFNMVSLYIYGEPLEKVVGRGFFVELYIMSGLIAGMSSVLYAAFTYQPIILARTFGIGASGAIFGIAGGVTMLVILTRGAIGRLTPMILGILVASGLLYGFVDGSVDNVAHIGGFISGLLLTRFIYVKKEHRI